MHMLFINNCIVMILNNLNVTAASTCTTKCQYTLTLHTSGTFHRINRGNWLVNRASSRDKEFFKDFIQSKAADANFPKEF